MNRYLVDAARSGDIDAVITLGVAAFDSNNSDILFVFLPIILDHIGKNSPNLNAAATPEILKTYLPLMGDILDAVSEWELPSVKASRLISLIDEKWEPVRRWMSFIMEKLIEVDTPLGDKAESIDIGRLYGFCADFLFSFASYTIGIDQFQIIKLIARGRLPGFLDLITRIWLHGARANSSMLAKMSLPFRAIATKVVHRIDPTPFANVMMQNSDSVSACLDNISESAKNQKFDAVYTSLYVLKLSLDWSHFDMHGNPVQGGPLVELRKRFLANRSIVVVTSALEEIAKHPECVNEENFTDQESAILIWHCVSYIADCLRSDGASFIVPALQNHLLQSTETTWRMVHSFKGSPEMNKELERDFGELFEAVTMHLHRADVLHECRKWHGSASNPSETDNEVSKKWKTLHSTVGRRLKQRLEYRTIKCQTCDNPKCSVVAAVALVDLKCCAKCGSAYYCSPGCQKAHWPEHKKVCGSSDNFSLATRRIDNNFAKWLVVQDFEFLKEELCCSIDKEINSPSACLFVYDDFPPKTDLCPGKVPVLPEGTILEEKTKNDILVHAFFNEGGPKRYTICEWVTLA